jgi:hypothetical protein
MPLFVSADLFSPRGHWFRVKVIGNEIRVFPGIDFDLIDFMAFYDMVVDRLDPEAVVVAPEAPK